MANKKFINTNSFENQTFFRILGPVRASSELNFSLSTAVTISTSYIFGKYM